MARSRAGCVATLCFAAAALLLLACAGLGHEVQYTGVVIDRQYQTTDQGGEWTVVIAIPEIERVLVGTLEPQDWLRLSPGTKVTVRARRRGEKLREVGIFPGAAPERPAGGVDG
jgi:hypothetical protein